MFNMIRMLRLILKNIRDERTVKNVSVVVNKIMGNTKNMQTVTISKITVRLKRGVKFFEKI